jgi:hypothetical protein
MLADYFTTNEIIEIIPGVEETLEYLFFGLYVASALSLEYTGCECPEVR